MTLCSDALQVRQEVLRLEGRKAQDVWPGQERATQVDSAGEMARRCITKEGGQGYNFR